MSLSDHQVLFPAAPVEGEHGANTDLLAPSKGTSGWTSPVDDRDRASTDHRDAVDKSVCDDDSRRNFISRTG